MQYFSTNHQTSNVGFKEAIEKSEAADGGLYMPEQLPLIPNAFLNNIAGMSLSDISFVVNSMFVSNDIPSITLKRICDCVSAVDMPLRQIEPDIYVLETFHGPTRTVKDFGAGFLSQYLRTLHTTNDSHLNVLVATTGNSGGAIANGFKDDRDVSVFVLFPRNISKRHLEEITKMGGHVHAIEVSGSIDSCRDIIAMAFNDPELNEKLKLTSANSSNIGYLLPTASIFFYAYAQLMCMRGGADSLYVSVPTGHCGTLLGACIAKCMGLPVDTIIAGCNSNGGLHEYFTGTHDTRQLKSHRTLAYGMDSMWSANLPRFKTLGQYAGGGGHLVTDVCDDEDIADTINDVAERTGYLLDPHSAISYSCMKRHKPDGAVGIVIATGHPEKSPETLARINRGALRLPPAPKVNYCTRPEAVIPPTYAAFRKYMRYFCDEGRLQA